MPYYQVWPKDDRVADSFWLEAASQDDARYLVSRNVPGASNAQDATIYDCVLDSANTPPAGTIYRRLNGPVSMRFR